MGIFDDIKGHADANEAQVEAGIDQAGDVIDERTGGKFAEHVDKAQQAGKDWVGSPQDESVPGTEATNEGFARDWTGDNQP
ncbi:MAG: antitoxin [Actinomycetes bacterium]